jgi:uncharacterized membrane protein
MAFCAKCGGEVAAGAAFCPKCGQTQQGGVEMTQTTQGTQSGLAENVAGLLCYVLGWVTGLIFFLIDKRPYVRFHAAQSMVVFGGLHLINIIVGVMFGAGLVLTGGWGAFGIGWLLYSIINLVALVLWIMLMVKAYQGEKFHVPVAGDIAQNLAGK